MNKVVKGLGIGCIGVVGIFVILSVMIAIFSPSSDKKSSENEEPIFVNESTAKTSEDGTVKEEKKSKWAYDNKETKMGDSQKFAQIASDDILNFDFPYDGGSSSILNIRKENGEIDIFYQISKGQIIAANAFEGGTVRVKFDNDKPMTVSANGPSDHSSDVIFLGSKSKLLSKIKTSKKMIMEIEFYNEGRQQIEFDIEGLEW